MQAPGLAWALADVLSPEWARALADAGGFALFILVVAVAGIGLWRRWWVPGWLYDQERQARLTAETQAVRNQETLASILSLLQRRDRRRRLPQDDSA